MRGHGRMQSVGQSVSLRRLKITSAGTVVCAVYTASPAHARVQACALEATLPSFVRVSALPPIKNPRPARTLISTLPGAALLNALGIPTRLGAAATVGAGAASATAAAASVQGRRGRR